MTIVLGAALVCAAGLIFAVLAVFCRSDTPPPLLGHDLVQTFSLLALMAMVAAGLGVFAEGFSHDYGTIHLVVAGAMAVGSIALVVVMAPWKRFPAAAAGPVDSLKPPMGGDKTG